MKCKIPFYKSWFPKGSRRYAHDALDSGWVGKGQYIQMATDKIKELFDYEHVLLTSSGTAAMILASVAYGVKSPPVYVPTNCYIAAVNPFQMQGDVRTYPVSSLTWNGYLPQDWEPDTNNVFVIVAVHNLGNPVDVPEIKRRFPRAVIIEDCCEALGASYHGRSVGSEAYCAALSFYSTKSVTSGEGGAFITSSIMVYEQAKLQSTQGQGSQPYRHISPGYNFRMSNLQAALLYGHLCHWQRILERKEDLFGYYRQRLQGVVETQLIAENCVHSAWVTGVLVPRSEGFYKARKFFDEAGIEIRPFFYPVNSHRHLSMTKIGCQEAADLLSNEIILLPSYPALIHEEKENLDYIIEKVKEYAYSF